eukprot:augustus_masked-scaffold_2-processed-gene-1.8-mRNA-1 protein AED:0.32 eAED:0.32 QI:0/-1/0/1/-1/1/1/0/133
MVIRGTKLLFNSIRQYNFTQTRNLSRISITFVNVDGDEETVKADTGDSILDVAFDNDIEIEGACGGQVACSTCHVILSQEVYNSLPEPDEEEEDMLDLALGVTETSRLGCQVILKEEHNGARILLPDDVMDFQ